MSRLSISISPDDHIQGNPTAECSLVEYGDYECPSCGQIQPVIQKLQRHFANRLSFVFRNFPLSEMHPWAEAAAETAEFADEYGKFWEMHDLLYKNQAVLSESLFLDLADKLDLSRSQLRVALEQRTNRARVRADFEAGGNLTELACCTRYKRRAAGVNCCSWEIAIGAVLRISSPPIFGAIVVPSELKAWVRSSRLDAVSCLPKRSTYGLADTCRPVMPVARTSNAARNNG